MLLAFLGIVFNYALRVNMNIVITFMTNQTALDLAQNASRLNSTGTDGPFVWDSIVTGDVVGMFFAGYMVFQLPGGRLAETRGGKIVLTVAMGGVAVLTLLIPEAAKLTGNEGYPYILVIIRVIMGLFEAATFPCVSSMLAKWAPPTERATMSAFVMAGSQAGTIVGFLLSGMLNSAWGWESVFYIEGGACFVWLLCWIIFAADSPAKHPRISDSEREYIISSLPATASESYPIPWSSLAKSPAVWAITISNVGNNWGFHLLMTELPIYLTQIFPVYMEDSTTVGIWSSVPYATMWGCSILFSLIADFLIRTNKLSTAVVRKVFDGLSKWVPILTLLTLVLAVTNDNKDDTLVLTLFMFTMAVGAMGGLYSGWITNPQDISPNFAGTVLGISNCIGSIPGFVAPAVASSIVNNDEKNTKLWGDVWLIAIGIMAFSSVIYTIFARGVPQDWNEPKKTTKKSRDWILVAFTVVVFVTGVTYAGATIGVNAY